MNEQIKALEDRIKVLEDKLNLSTMPFEIKEIIRGEVVKDIDPLTPATRQESISIGDLPVTLTLPINPTGFLVLKATSGREYNVFYV
jgi:hypothetical protein